MIVKEMQHVGKKFQAVQKGFTGNLSPTLTPAHSTPAPEVRGSTNWGPSKAVFVPKRPQRFALVFQNYI